MYETTVEEFDRLIHESMMPMEESEINQIY